MYELTNVGEQGGESAGVIKMKKRAPKELKWTKVNYTVTTEKETKTILDNTWGNVKPGQVCAVMGPSGSGKSSLLNVLSGRSSSVGPVKVSGKIEVGDVVINPVEFRRNIAYVMQDDALMATATPREAIKFSACLRLDSQFSDAEIDELVYDILKSLGITDCADTFIGNEMFKGISGGQRKRTSVGVELITNPSLLFLDEPTSGLDSYAAFKLVELLNEFAKTNCTVLCTIHQPSSEVFFLFDQVIFLVQGRILYQGPVSGINSHFSYQGFKCPSNYNPADYVMFLSQTESMEGLSKVMMQEEKLSKGPSADDLLAIVSASEDGSIALNAKASFGKQFYYLVAREVQATLRNKPALIGRFGITIFLNGLFSLIFMGAGDKDDSDPNNFTSHFGALTMVTISSMFGAAQPILLSFPFERPLFMREYSTGTYGVVSYFISKLLMEMPLNFLQVCCQYALVYTIVGLNGEWIYLILTAWGLGLASGSVALALGCACGDVKTATELSPLLLVPQMLFAGFFVKTSQIPVFLRWAQYLCSLKYAMNLILFIEFYPSNDNCRGGAQENCIAVLRNNDIIIDQWWVYMIILIALFAGFRIAAAFILQQKAKRFY